MDIFEAVRAKALRAVLKPDGEYIVRYIFRWYSRTFSTPLEEVYDLPLEDVLMHYYESWFEDMDEQNRLEAIDSVLESDADRLARKIAEDTDAVDNEDLVAMLALIPAKQPPAVFQGDEEVPQGDIAAPPPMPAYAPPPELSMSFPDDLDSNLIPDDIESLNSMRQPEEEE